MALHKEITLKSGISISHWVIREFSVDREAKRVLIAVTPYVSKDFMEHGGSPISSERIVIQVEDLEYPSGMEWKNAMHYSKYFSPEALRNKDIYDSMYAYLKTNIEFFRDAEDA